MIAATTDFLDGLTARWLAAQSQTGRLLDPVADKVFVLVLVGTLIAEDAIGIGWALAVASRDIAVVSVIAMLLIRGRFSHLRSMRPRWLGKCSTAAQFALLTVVVVVGHGWLWLLVLTAGLSIAATLDYGRMFIGWDVDARDATQVS